MEQSLRDDERPFGKRPWGPYAVASTISTSERFQRQREASVRLNKAARLREESGKRERERERYLTTPRIAATSNWVVEEGIVIPRHLPTVSRDDDRSRKRKVVEISSTVTTATVGTAAVPQPVRKYRRATATTSAMSAEQQEAFFSEFIYKETEDKDNEPPLAPATLPRARDEEHATRVGAGAEGGTQSDDVMPGLDDVSEVDDFVVLHAPSDEEFEMIEEAPRQPLDDRIEDFKRQGFLLLDDSSPGR